MRRQFNNIRGGALTRGDFIIPMKTSTSRSQSIDMRLDLQNPTFRREIHLCIPGTVPSLSKMTRPPKPLAITAGILLSRRMTPPQLLLYVAQVTSLWSTHRLDTYLEEEPMYRQGDSTEKTKVWNTGRLLNCKEFAHSSHAIEGLCACLTLPLQG
jgi:hypothetical protein